MRRFSGLLAGCLTLVTLLSPLLARPASAGESREHDGFFLRLSTGAGSASAEISDATGGLKLSGTAGDANLAIGKVVGTNLAIHATIWGWSINDPDADITIVGIGSGSGQLNGTATMSAIGIGFTQYVMPMNAYLSGSLGLGSLTVDGDLSGSSESGLALDLTIGKEWWVGSSWGLGVAGDFNYFSAKDKDVIGAVNETWSGPGFGVRFSATFN